MTKIKLSQKKEPRRGRKQGDILFYAADYICLTGFRRTYNSSKKISCVQNLPSDKIKKKQAPGFHFMSGITDALTTPATYCFTYDKRETERRKKNMLDGP